MDDMQITELLRNRDERAIEALQSVYGRLCERIAGNFLRSREDVEECVNSAYFAVWNQIPPDAPPSLQTYLLRIVKNIAIDRLKYNTAEKRSPALTVSLDELSECIPAPQTDSADASALGEAISRFLRAQDALHRKVFVRRYWYGESVAEIAAACGLKERTCATYLFRTRKRLKAFLLKEGFDYE